MKNLRSASLICALPIVIGALALLSGCSGDRSVAIRYQAEKLLNGAERLYKTATIKPNLQDRERWREIKNAYTGVTRYCWKNLDSIPTPAHQKERSELEMVAFMAANRLTGIYYAERQFDSAIVVLNQLLTFTHLEGQALLTSRLNLARVQQARGNWDDAMASYRTVIDTFYPPVDNDNAILTPVLNLPLEIVGINRTLGDTTAVETETNSAIRYYEKLTKDWPNTALATAARSNLARLYSDLQDWDNAIRNLNLMTDSTGQTSLEASLMTADLTAMGRKNYSEAIRMYNDLLTRTKDSSFLGLVNARIGTVYYENKDYPRCREYMMKIKDDYPRFFRSNPIPQDYIALSLAGEGNWPLAENEFLWLIDNYSTTESAFNAFLVIAQHYLGIKDSSGAATWYKRGNEFYDKMIRQYGGTAIEASALSYKAEIARRQNQWNTAAQQLLELYRKFPETDVGKQSAINAALVYRDKLGDPAKADSLVNWLRRELMPIENGKNINSVSDDNK